MTSRLQTRYLAGLDASSVVDGQTIPAFTVSIDDPFILRGTGNLSNMDKIQLPHAGTENRPLTGKRIGSLFFNETTDRIETWNGTAWVETGTSGTTLVNIGTSANPATSGQQLNYYGFDTGYYYIRPTGESTTYRMYVDNRRYAGGWVCCATVRRENCQSHVITGSYGLYTTDGINYGPVYTSTTTMKMTDTFIQNLRNSSTYRGQTPTWLESGHWTNNYGPKNMFFPYAMTFQLNASASEQNARTTIAKNYEGLFDDRNPNTGTRGMGDHHTSGGVYFAWGRHPEDGNNCGFREDTLGQANGWLWVK
jgi:hypothetical protein